MEHLWKMKPVQNGLKALLAGCAVGGSVLAYKKANAFLKGSTYEISQEFVSKLSKDTAVAFQELVKLDADFGDLIMRLEPFRRFCTKAFDDIILKSAHAVSVRSAVYDSKITATKSFQVRRAYQAIIDSIRILRSVIETSLKDDIEDFDEVASDINSKVEQACTDIIQDHALL